MTKLVNHRWFCNDCLKCEPPSQPKSHTKKRLNLETDTPTEENTKLHCSSSIESTSHLLETLDDQVDILSAHQKSIMGMEKMLKELLSHTRTIEDQQEKHQSHLQEIKSMAEENDKQLKEFSKNIRESLTENLKDTFIAVKNLEEKLDHQNYSEVLGRTAEQKKFTESQTVEPTVNPECTVIVLRVSDRKLVSNSSKIKQTFNQNFPDIAIRNAFLSKGGTVFIELKDKEAAKKVIENWKGHYFSSGNSKTGSSNSDISTICKLLSEKNKSIILKEIPTDITDEELTKEIGKQYPEAVAKRFVNRQKRKLTTVKIDFHTMEHQTKSLKDGVKIFQVLYREAEIYKHRQRIIQCFKCFRFGHVARLCKDRTQLCRDCGGDHHHERCESREKKCINCHQKHEATNPACRHYLEIVEAIREKFEINLKVSTHKTTDNILSKSDFIHNY